MSRLSKEMPILSIELSSTHNRNLLKMVGAGNVSNDGVEDTRTARRRYLLHQVEGVYQAAGQGGGTKYSFFYVQHRAVKSGCRA